MTLVHVHVRVIVVIGGWPDWHQLIGREASDFASPAVFHNEIFVRRKAGDALSGRDVHVHPAV